MHKHWRLNERHYGALQGFNKQETIDKHGEDQVFKWRRIYDSPPPPLDLDDPRHPRFDQKYSDLPLSVLPRAESLKMTFDRVTPLWSQEIEPLLHQDQRVLIVAHLNTLRALALHINLVSLNEISQFNLPTATPLVLEFNSQLQLSHKFFEVDAVTL